MQLPRDLRGADHSRLATAGTEHDEREARRGPSEGHQAVFRQAYIGSRLPQVGMVLVDGVRVHQVEGPVEGRDVYINQRPTPGKLAWTKAHHQRQFGVGSLVTLADLEISIPDEPLAKVMRSCSDRCSAGLGLLAACLDERATFRVLFENLIVFNPSGDIWGVADHVKGVRNFGPDREWGQSARADLEALSLSDHLRTACRWFLRGVQSGPSESAFMFLATAIESLVNDPDVGKAAFDVKAIREAYEAAGGQEDGLPMGIGPCAGLRGEVIHKGVDDDDKLRSAWYSLERVARLLLRDKLGYESPWPLDPSEGVEGVREEEVRERHFFDGSEE